jgi:hypothetical protein
MTHNGMTHDGVTHDLDGRRCGPPPRRDLGKRQKTIAVFGTGVDGLYPRKIHHSRNSFWL